MVVLPRLMVLLAPFLFAAAAMAQPVLPGGGGGRPAPGGAPAAAPTGLYTKITGPQLAQILGGLTYNNNAVQVQVETNSNGSWFVSMPLWGSQISSGASLDVCENDGSGCHWIAFVVDLGVQQSIDANWINGYQSSYYGGRAYKTSENHLIIDHAVWILPGVTADYIKQSVGMFEVAVEEALKFKP